MLTASEIAQIYGLALRGDKSAAAFLKAQGITLGEEENVRSNEPQEKPIPESIKQLDNHANDSTGITEHTRTLDFSFFTVKSALHYQTRPENESPAQLTGRAYRADDDTPDTLPVNQDNTELTQVFSKPVISPLRLTLNKIKQALRHQQLTAQIAIPRVVRNLAKGEAIKHFPKLSRIRPAQKLTLYVDCGNSCHGTVQDALEIARALMQQYPNSTVYLLRDGLTGLWRTPHSIGWQNTTVPLPAESAGLCLVATVLSNHNIHQWQHLAARLKLKHIRPIWLSTRGQNNLKATPPSFGTILPWGAQQNSSLHKNPLALLTAALISCRWIDGALLRKMCQAMLLPAVYETKFWQQPFTYYEPGCDRGALELNKEQKREYMAELKSQSSNTLSELSALIESYLATKSNAQLHEHRLHFSLLTHDHQWQHNDIQTSIDFIQSLGINIRQTGEHSKGNARYLLEMARQWDGYLEEAPLKVRLTLSAANAYGLRTGITHSTPSSLVSMVQAEMAKNTPETQILNIYQKNDRIIAIREEAGALNNTSAKSPHQPHRGLPNALLATVHNTPNSPVEVNPGSNPSLLFENQIVRKPYSKALTLKSTHSELELVKRTSNEFYWASSLAISSNGVIAETEHLIFEWPAKGLDEKKSVIEKTHIISQKSGCIITLQNGSPEWLLGKQADSGELSGGTALSGGFLLDGGPDIAISPPQLDEYGLFLTLSYSGENYNLRYIPADSFLMGSPESELLRNENEQLQPVQIDEGFWLGETTISQTLWHKIMGNEPGYFKTKQTQSDTQLPIENISWKDCMAFCSRLTEIVRPQLPELTLHLPTEAQWEYACRAGTNTPFYTGEQINKNHANFDTRRAYTGKAESIAFENILPPTERTVDIRAERPNPWGLHHMHGNIQEWCLNTSEKEQHNSSVTSEQIENALAQPTSGNKAIKGGSWNSSANQCRSAYRNSFPPTHKSNEIGLRICARITASQKLPNKENSSLEI